jgi:hypothetical protein
VGKVFCLEVFWEMGGFVVVGSLACLSLGMTLSNLQEMMIRKYYIRRH